MGKFLLCFMINLMMNLQQSEESDAKCLGNATVIAIKVPVDVLPGIVCLTSKVWWE